MSTDGLLSFSVITMWFLPACLLMLIQAARGKEQCICSQLHHPQDKFCSADFAFRVELLDGYDSPAPGEADEDQLFYSYWMYTAQIVEVFKGAESDMRANVDDILDFYTPQRALCGRVSLYDEEQPSNEYLFTGTIEVSESGVTYAAITGCTWVEKWSDLKEEQIEGLRGSYSSCNCTIYPVSGEKFTGKPPRNRFNIQTCVFNPVSAKNLQVTDCELLYGSCIWNGERNGCEWKNEGLFQTCFQARKQSLVRKGKPAVSTRAECSLFNGRKKKQCIMKFLKAARKERPMVGRRSRH
ncbi:putative metalloproteinase inhibitor 1-like [Apostichopus japonicus]|uniref:Putative metalloproteinase inhibitor 1-like n=2 Tax=Stichopus japonicus TaxID=307972 RepID=A0A2G8L005_STIJA|nr:putative metalloproteinase inhibitor 1-like [Apostichopus japonicus]